MWVLNFCGHKSTGMCGHRGWDLRKDINSWFQLIEYFLCIPSFFQRWLILYCMFYFSKIYKIMHNNIYNWMKFHNVNPWGNQHPSEGTKHSWRSPSSPLPSSTHSSNVTPEGNYALFSSERSFASFGTFKKWNLKSYTLLCLAYLPYYCLKFTFIIAHCFKFFSSSLPHVVFHFVNVHRFYFSVLVLTDIWVVSIQGPSEWVLPSTFVVNVRAHFRRVRAQGRTLWARGLQMFSSSGYL